MFGALSSHYKREEEHRLAQLHQQQLHQQQAQQLHRLQEQRAALVAAQAQAAAANGKNQLNQPTNGQYISRSPNPPPRNAAGQQPPYRSQSTYMPPSQLRNGGDLSRVQRVDQQMKPSHSDGSFPRSSSEDESDDGPPARAPSKPVAYGGRKGY